METEKQTIGATAKLLGVTPATVRNWVHLYGSSHLSEDANRTTSKRFTPEDIDTLRKVQHLLNTGSTYNQVQELLPATPEIFTEGTPEGTQKAPEQPETDETPASGSIQPLEWFQRFQNILEMQQEQHQETIKAKDALIEELKQDKATLQAEVERLKKPWYRRIFEK